MIQREYTPAHNLSDIAAAMTGEAIGSSIPVPCSSQGEAAEGERSEATGVLRLSI